MCFVPRLFPSLHVFRSSSPRNCKGKGFPSLPNGALSNQHTPSMVADEASGNGKAEDLRGMDWHSRRAIRVLDAVDTPRGSGTAINCINLICGGKILKDDGGSQPLQQLGMQNNSKVLTSATSPDRGKALKDEESAQADRSNKLSRIS